MKFRNRKIIIFVLILIVIASLLSGCKNKSVPSNIQPTVKMAATIEPIPTVENIAVDDAQEKQESNNLEKEIIVLDKTRITDLPEMEQQLNAFISNYSEYDFVNNLYNEYLLTDDEDFHNLMNQIIDFEFSYYWTEGGCHLYICRHYDGEKYSFKPTELDKKQLVQDMDDFETKLMNEIIEISLVEFTNDITESQAYKTDSDIKDLIDLLYGFGYTIYQSEGGYYLTLCKHYTDSELYEKYKLNN